MSLKTWKDEYYPIPADACPADKAVEHSLRKWQGLRPHALHAHGVEYIAREVMDPADKTRRTYLRIDSTSCALCRHYLSGDRDCSKCPLCIARGGTPCDATMDGEGTSPYGRVAPGKAVPDPEPMIYWLEQCNGRS